MAELTTLLIEEVIGTGVTDDGLHGLIQVQGAAGENVLAVPLDRLGAFASATGEFARSRARRHDDGTQDMVVMPVLSWTCGSVVDADALVLALRAEDGSEVSYMLPAKMARAMREVMGVALGDVAAPQGQPLSS